MRIFSAISFVSLFVVLFYCCVENTKPEVHTPNIYVGSAKCQSCHAKEYTNYTGSDHFHAMDSALPRSVKGNFNNSYFVYFGDTSFFLRKDGGYFVRTKDSLGNKKEFKVDFTFGWNPLQQYLVKFDDGRIQTLPFCWDTRPKEKGGQKWFHIYGKDKILPGDELFWMDINQNWNNMCADCHTTDYKKKFDITSNTFHSSWGESNVSCESCHGPASGHLKWVDKKIPTDSLKGFSFNLAGERLSWTFNDQKGIAYPDKKIQNNVQIETCARCHARATRLTDNYYHGQSFLQTHIPSTVSTANYYIDGQIREEDYEYGSFLQSKMYANGVTCINCHDAHSMKLKAPGNMTCASCHAPAKFDVEEHTHHPENSIGAACANCHMPVTTYMGVDDRRDHSIRIPRPDLSLKMGTPNACNKCHTNETVSWAAKYFTQWYAEKLPKKQTYGELLSAIAKNTENSLPAWNTLMNSNDYPGIIKSTVLEQYPLYVLPQKITELQKYLQHIEPNFRLNALHAVAVFPPEEIAGVVKPMLNDPVLTVRTEAINVLLGQYGQLDQSTKQRFDQVLSEYLIIQRNMSDRPEGYLNQGIVLTGTGRTTEAEQIYLLGIQRFPEFSALYANLADLYRALGNEERSKEYIQRGLSIEPKNATLHYSMALWYFRNHDEKNGLSALQKSIQLNPSDPSFTYAYAIGQFSRGEQIQAVRTLETFLEEYGNQPQVLDGLISIFQDLRQTEKANFYLQKRKSVFGY